MEAVFAYFESWAGTVSLSGTFSLNYPPPQKKILIKDRK